MTVVRIKGIKRYRSKGQWFCYHRKTGIRIMAEFGTGAFMEELAAAERKAKGVETIPGTLGMLLEGYRRAPLFTELAPRTRQDYARMMSLLKPLHDMPLAELNPPFIAGLRDKMVRQHGRRQANYILSVVSVACEFGREQGVIAENPVRGIRRARRPRGTPQANRPWTEIERRTVLTALPAQLRTAVALAMFTGLRKGDVLGLTKSALRDGRIWRRANKNGVEISLPIHPDLISLLEAAPKNDAVTIVATSKGTPWTETGFNSSFRKSIAKLVRDGRVGAGLTFHGLRHTCGTLLVEAGVDIDTVRRWLGQKTLAMAVRYTQSADTSERMREINERFDPLGSKKGT